MTKVNFPKTMDDKIMKVWMEGNGSYVALSENDYNIILYIWDGFSKAWNERIVFTKVEFTQKEYAK